MIITLSDSTSNAVLDLISDMADGGAIELLTDDRVRLALLKLDFPATEDASGGEIEFNEIREAAATMRGQAALARVLDSEGREVLTCDVGDSASDAVIKLNTIEIYPGGPVRLKSFRLVMP